MKKISTLLVALFVSAILMAQTPQSFNYQAVARNSAGAALANQSIQVRLSILRGATSLYSETRTVTTNLLGLFNVQIGSAGATATTGSFTTIYWLNNTPAVSLKVELDISNSNVFTDMGTRPLSSVPYALAATTAVETVNLAGRYIDPIAVPATGDVLQWNGSAWTPFTLPAAPVLGSWQGTISSIPFGGGGAPFIFAGPTATVTVDGTQKIMATATGVFGNTNANPQPCSFSMCWSLVAAGSPLTSFQGNSYTDGTVLEGASGNKTNLTATGLVTLPAGTYKIGFGIKNKSLNVNLSANDFVNGTYMIIK